MQSVFIQLPKRFWVILLALGIMFSVVGFTESIPTTNIEPKHAPKTKFKVMLDAGHGGSDPGNLGTGRYKTKEKQVALAVTLQLGKYITENFEDVEVLYTRKKDVFVKVHNRSKMANDAKADLFISIHCNSSDKQSAYGADTFVMGLDKTEANLRVAKKENAAILLEEDYERTYQGFDPNSEESLVAISLAQNVFLDQSIHFAALIQKQFKERVGRRDRGVQQAPFWVISRNIMPSILVELGFLTNREEEDFLQSKQGQTYMASAIYRAFKEYKAQIQANNVDHIPISEGTLKEQKVNDNNQELPQEQKENHKMENKAHSSETKNVNLVFKVQFASASKSIPLKPENFKGLKNVEEISNGSIYKYVVGKFNNLNDATKFQSTVREKGYKDAFVVVYNGKNRIPVSEALQMMEESK